MRLLNEPGDQSHTVAELAARHPVTVGTAYAAMALLNDEGLIEVTRHQPVAAGHRLDQPLDQRREQTTRPGSRRGTRPVDSSGLAVDGDVAE
jgi:DNA-binding transcriptional regulator YhcF (GntR family)